MMIAISLLLTIWSIDYANGETGKATYYGGNENGNACGYDHVDSNTFPFGYYAACGSDVFNDGYGCGKCYKIKCTGPYGNNPSCYCSDEEVIISCMDQCPECSSTHFDLNPAAMELIVGPGLSGTCGVISITYERVNCDYTGNIQIRPKSGTSAYWYGLHIDDIAGAGSVSEVQLKSSGTSSYGITCTKGEGPSFWICNGPKPYEFPLSAKLTSDQGDTITCDGCITSASATVDFGSNFPDSNSLGDGTSSGGSSPVSSPTDPPVEAPVESPTEPPVSSGGSSSGCDSASIRIKQNQGVSGWWYAVEFPDGDIDCVTKIEFRDSTHSSWIEGQYLDWGAYTFPHGGVQFSGSQHFRITTNGGMQASWNVFSGISPNSIATINKKSSFTYEDSDGGSSLSTAGLVAIIIVSLLCILCVGAGIWYYKREGINKGEASFQDTAADTPRDEPMVTDNNNEDEAEIEVEMNVETTR